MESGLYIQKRESICKKMWNVVGSKSGNRSVVSNEYIGLAGSESLGGGIFSTG